MTTPVDLDALEARLRKKAHHETSKPENHVCWQAAEAIRELRERVEKLRQENLRFRKAISGSGGKHEVIRSDDRGGPPVVKTSPENVRGILTPPADTRTESPVRGEGGEG